jgi:hypothetical protein
MNFLLLILLDISASDDDSSCISVARRPHESPGRELGEPRRRDRHAARSCSREDSAQFSKEPIR